MRHSECWLAISQFPTDLFDNTTQFCVQILIYNRIHLGFDCAAAMFSGMVGIKVKRKRKNVDSRDMNMNFWF